METVLSALGATLSSAVNSTALGVSNSGAVSVGHSYNGSFLSPTVETARAVNLSGTGVAGL